VADSASAGVDDVEKERAMAKKGRHGGNHNQADELRNNDPTTIAARNTDVDSRAGNRNPDRGGGHKIGER
jgi:hypothetical protein